MYIRSMNVIQQEVSIRDPVVTSFGSMSARHMILVELTDSDGRRGIGESWVNFPAWAPWERKAALERVFAPALQKKRIDNIPAFMEKLLNIHRGPALQAGAPGPLLQALCGIELALWDLLASIKEVPLCKLWFGCDTPRVRVYASGVNPPLPVESIKHYLDCGVTLFKLKLGFGAEADCENIRAMKSLLGENAELAVDVNRKWTFTEAAGWLPRLRDIGVAWLEEPLCLEEEHRLGELTERKIVPIAAGENVMMPPGADAASLATTPVNILQPDITKYCSADTAVRLIAEAEKLGKRVVPHFLGSAPGQLASAHLAAGCNDPLVEWDLNPNPLHDEFYRNRLGLKDGCFILPDRPGLGWEPQARKSR